MCVYIYIRMWDVKSIGGSRKREDVKDSGVNFVNYEYEDFRSSRADDTTWNVCFDVCLFNDVLFRNSVAM